MQEIIVHVDTYNIEEKLDTIIENQEQIITNQQNLLQSNILITTSICLLIIYRFIERLLKA